MKLSQSKTKLSQSMIMASIYLSTYLSIYLSIYPCSCPVPKVPGLVSRAATRRTTTKKQNGPPTLCCPKIPQPAAPPARGRALRPRHDLSWLVLHCLFSNTKTRCRGKNILASQRVWRHGRACAPAPGQRVSVLFCPHRGFLAQTGHERFQQARIVGGVLQETPHFLGEGVQLFRQLRSPRHPALQQRRNFGRAPLASAESQQKRCKSFGV